MLIFFVLRQHREKKRSKCSFPNMKPTLRWPPAKPIHSDPSKGTKFDLTPDIYQTDRLGVHTQCSGFLLNLKGKIWSLFFTPWGLDFPC